MKLNDRVIATDDTQKTAGDNGKRAGHTLIFRTWITRNGQKLYARDYGRKAWAFWV